MLRYCETKNFRRKLFIPPLIQKLFRYQKICETQHRRVALRNVSVLWDKKLPKENLDLPHPLIHKLFRYRKFLKTQHRRVDLRNISVLWDENNSTEKRKSTSLCLTIFDTRNWWNTKGYPYEFFRHRDKKLSTEKGDTPRTYP